MFAYIKDNEFLNAPAGAFVITEVASFMPDYEVTRIEHDGTAAGRSRAFAQANNKARSMSDDSITGGYGYSYTVTEEFKIH